MALIQCPECKKEVSSAAKSCPFCGYPIAQTSSDTVRIAIDQHPNVLGCIVPIKDISGRLLVNANAGSVATIKTETPIKIQLCGTFGMPLITVLVEPGKKYRATWGVGFFSPRIQDCHEVDIIDS